MRVVTTSAPLAVIASSDTDYARLGLARDDIEPWEDRARTDDRPGSYEWWYFDAHLKDGAKLVVVFMDKDVATPQKPLDPTIRLNLDLVDGRSFEKIVTFDPALWSSAKDHADVRIGENRFTGDLRTYRINATVDEITVDITLEREVSSWRPETGYMLFGEERNLEFSWLPAVPQGKVTAKYSIGEEQHETTGTGYHDHNWGNVGLMDVIHNWYWARGQACRDALNLCREPDLQGHGSHEAGPYRDAGHRHGQDGRRDAPQAVRRRLDDRPCHPPHRGASKR
jgi:hypothetical protein